MPDKWLLITGSRVGAESLYPFVPRIVAWAQRHGYQIIVGDAGGIDEQVIKACDEAGVTCDVHGAYGKVRRTPKLGKTFPHPGRSYPERNWIMAAGADNCIALWDGHSHGARITFVAAKQMGVPTFVIDASIPESVAQGEEVFP